ncbi:MAG: hypothetical protein ACOC32_00125 [Nanoarchaeota archaeon]
MGFLGLLHNKKKKDTSLPPPAPGPGKEGVPKGPDADKKDDDKKAPGPGDAPQGPQPPAPQPPKADGNQENKQDDKNPEVPQGPAPKDPNSMNQQGPQAPGQPPAVPPGAENMDFPKLDLPTFPGAKTNQDMQIPTFNGQESPSQNNEEKPEQGPSEKQDADAPQNPTGFAPQQPPAFDQGSQAASQPDQAPQGPAFPPVQQQGEDEHVPEIGQSGPAQQPQGEEQQAPQQQEQRQSEQSQPAPWSRNSYLSQDEEHLNDLKHKLHKPSEEIGTDSSMMGNVERNIKKRISKQQGPLFVEINNYKRVLNSVDEIKRDLNESQEFILKLDEFNDKKHGEFDKWKKAFEYIQTKLHFVDKTLFEESK